jgi:malate dehydrogenase (oxaloacetate-decarboxylating)
MSTETPSRRRGVAVLEDPLLNKGTAFSATERDELGLHGLVPPVVETLEQQAERADETLGRYDDDLTRHVYLRSLQDANEVLFYTLVVDHVEELLPLVYTPTVARACQQWSVGAG